MSTVQIHSSPTRAVQGPIKPDPPSTKPIALAIGNRFHFPKIEIGGSGIGSPPLKAEKLKPRSSQDLAKNGQDLVRFRPFCNFFLIEFWPFFIFSRWIIVVFQILNPNRFAQHLLKLQPAQFDSSPNRRRVDDGYTWLVRVGCGLSLNPIRPEQWIALSPTIKLSMYTHTHTHTFMINHDRVKQKNSKL